MPTQYRTRQASEYRRNIAKLQSDLSKHLGALSELIRILSVVVVVVVVVGRTRQQPGHSWRNSDSANAETRCT